MDRMSLQGPKRGFSLVELMVVLVVNLVGDNLRDRLDIRRS